MFTKNHKNTRKAAREGGESVTVTASDVGSVTDVLSAKDQSPAVAEAAPAADPVVPAENQEVPANLDGVLGLKAPKAPDKAAVVVAAKGELTRNQPMKLNHGFKEKGDRMAKNKAISNGGRLFRAGKGNGSGANTVWGHCLTVAKRLGAESTDNGTFTAQQLYNALYETDWVAAGVTRPKYTPANGVAYAGWIHDLVKGAPSKSFAIVEPVAEKPKADKAE